MAGAVSPKSCVSLPWVLPWSKFLGFNPTQNTFGSCFSVVLCSYIRLSLKIRQLQVCLRSVQIINLFVFTSSEIFGLTQFISTSLCALIIGHGKQSDYR